jgi:hypothetical protein
MTARALADVPVSYPRRVVCFQNDRGCGYRRKHHARLIRRKSRTAMLKSSGASMLQI